MRNVWPVKHVGPGLRARLGEAGLFPAAFPCPVTRQMANPAANLPGPRAEKLNVRTKILSVQNKKLKVRNKILSVRAKIWNGEDKILSVRRKISNVRRKILVCKAGIFTPSRNILKPKTLNMSNIRIMPENLAKIPNRQPATPN